MREIGIEIIETFISYPKVDEDEDLEFTVRYNEEPDEYMNGIPDLEDNYAYTLQKLILSEKQPKCIKLDKWKSDHSIPIVHDYPILSTALIQYPSKDTAQDRVVLIYGYYNVGKYVLDFMMRYIPKYIIRHINHKTKELLSDEFSITSILSNGKQIHKGGEGLASDSDIIIITKPSHHTQQYEYLQIQLFLKNLKIEAYLKHCQNIAQREKNKIGKLLSSWLVPKCKNLPRSGYVDMSEEIKPKEFDSALSKDIGTQVLWSGTKAKQILIISYDNSIKIFDRKFIVRNFKPKYGRHFILSIIKLILYYSPKREKMKVECVVKHLWAKDECEESESKEEIE